MSGDRSSPHRYGHRVQHDVGRMSGAQGERRRLAADPSHRLTVVAGLPLALACSRVFVAGDQRRAGKPGVCPKSKCLRL